MEEQIGQFVADQRDLQARIIPLCDVQVTHFNGAPVDGNPFNNGQTMGQTDMVQYGDGQGGDGIYGGGQQTFDAPQNFNAPQNDMYGDNQRDSRDNSQMDTESYNDGKRDRGSFGDGQRDRDHDRRRGDRDRNRYRKRDRRRRDRSRDRHGDRSQRDRSRDRSDDAGDGGRYGDRYNDNYNDNNTSSGYQDENSRSNWSGDRDGNNSDDDGHSGGYGRNRGAPQHRGGEKWITDTPSQTILLKGLPQHVDEKDIRAELMMFGAPIKEVRLMKRKDNGVSRGFAFVEFQELGDAQRWKESNQGQVVILNQYTVSMYYSTPRSAVEMPEIWTRLDWSCAKCGVHNFKRRDHCFRCSLSREESEKVTYNDGSDQVGTNPCNTLILRGLDALTTEETIVAALAKVTAHTVKNMKVIRDDVTSTSRGFGFIEMNSIQDSTNLLDVISKLTPFEVDGKAVLVSYAKNTFSTVIATMSQWNQPTTPWDQYSAQGMVGTQAAAMAGYYTGDQYAAYYAGTEYAAAATVGGPGTTQTDSTNAAAAVAQAAIQKNQAVKHYHKQQEEMQRQIMAKMQDTDRHGNKRSSQWSSVATHNAATAKTAAANVGTEQAKYSAPDVSTFQYDETSGYYYDPQTTLYYDANSQYFYNSQSGSFLYWDGEQQTYRPAPSDVQAKPPTTELQPDVATDAMKPPPVDEKKDKDKKEKVKVAKRIAKDMEKWAKMLNAQKEGVKKVPMTMMPSAPGYRLESATADCGFALFEQKTVPDHQGGETGGRANRDQMPPPAQPGGEPDGSSLVASYGGGDDSGEEESDGAGGATEDVELDEASLTDWTKMACLLCKRQFSTKEMLMKHTNQSDLHKKNLEERRKANTRRSTSVQEALSYRDRAKERRQKYGIPQPPAPPKKVRQPDEPIPFEQPTTAGIGESNIGNQLLQKMGWNKGKGLGKTGQGIVNPITATKRQAQAGLGARGSSYNIEPGVTYKDCVKKTMFARYHDLE